MHSPPVVPRRSNFPRLTSTASAPSTGGDTAVASSAMAAHKESYTGRSSERTGKATGLVDLMGKQGSAISGGSCLSLTCSVDLGKRSEIGNAFPGKV